MNPIAVTVLNTYLKLGETSGNRLEDGYEPEIEEDSIVAFELDTREWHFNVTSSHANCDIHVYSKYCSMSQVGW